MTRKRRSRGGRPKAPLRPRIDLGTQQLQEKRLHISPKDQTLSTCPLDALKGRGLISDEAHSAAVEFRRCHHLKFGPPHVRAANILATSGGDPTESAEAERRYRDGAQMLTRMSRQHFDAIDNLVIHERFPSWMFGEPNSVARKKTLEGFGILLAWYRRSRRAVGMAEVEPAA